MYMYAPLVDSQREQVVGRVGVATPEAVEWMTMTELLVTGGGPLVRSLLPHGPIDLAALLHQGETTVKDMVTAPAEIGGTTTTEKEITLLQDTPLQDMPLPPTVALLPHIVETFPQEEMRNHLKDTHQLLPAVAPLGMAAGMSIGIILLTMMLTVVLLREWTPLLTGKRAQMRIASSTIKEGAGTMKRRGMRLVIVRNSIMTNDPTTRTQGVEIEGEGCMVETLGRGNRSVVLTDPQVIESILRDIHEIETGMDTPTDHHETEGTTIAHQEIGITIDPQEIGITIDIHEIMIEAQETLIAPLGIGIMIALLEIEITIGPQEKKITMTALQEIGIMTAPLEAEIPMVTQTDHLATGTILTGHQGTEIVMATLEVGMTMAGEVGAHQEMNHLSDHD